MKIIKLILIIILIVIPQISSALINSSKLYDKGVQTAKEGNLDEAIEIFKKVIEVSPYYSLGHYGLGKCYLQKEDNIKEAIDELKIAVDLDKKLARGYFYLGIAYMYNKNYPYSISAFYTSFEIDKRNYAALYNIGSVYDLMGHTVKSEKFYSDYFNQKEKTEIFEY